MILYEKQIIDYMRIPSIPKREFDGVTSFDKGVAILELYDGTEAYAVCSYRPDKGHKKPMVTKVFGLVPFVGVKHVYVVPDYMANESDVRAMDLDDESKKKAQELLQEATELENGGLETIEFPSHEYYFDHITNDDEAMAFIASYNKSNKVRGKVPTTHDGLLMRLAVIYSELKNKK